MNIEIFGSVAVVRSEVPVITDAQSALDLIAAAGFTHHVRNIALYKSALSEDFFRLSTGLAGEVVQKFVNYNCRFAVIGDFSQYSSRALQSYMHECNQGRHIFFAGSEKQALEALAEKE